MGCLIMSLIKAFCKHKSVKIIACEKDKNKYIVQCTKCGEQIAKPKAIGEMYNIGTIVKYL